MGCCSIETPRLDGTVNLGWTMNDRCATTGPTDCTCGMTPRHLLTVLIWASMTTRACGSAEISGESPKSQAMTCSRNRCNPTSLFADNGQIRQVRRKSGGRSPPHPVRVLRADPSPWDYRTEAQPHDWRITISVGKIVCSAAAIGSNSVRTAASAMAWMG